jgi:carnosine N-methyltransferase
MLLASSFMLNHSVCTQQWTIHPWLLSNCNHLADSDQLRGVPIPDVAPNDLVQPGLLSMCAGDFAVRC